MAGGELLQGAAYAAADVPGTKIGRYLALKEGLDPRTIVAELDSGDGAVMAGLSHAVVTLLGAARGSLFPRVEDLEGHANPACRNCEVRTACLLEDSGMRMRWHEVVRAALDARMPGRRVRHPTGGSRHSSPCCVSGREEAP